MPIIRVAGAHQAFGKGQYTAGFGMAGVYIQCIFRINFVGVLNFILAMAISPIVKNAVWQFDKVVAAFVSGFFCIQAAGKRSGHSDDLKNRSERILTLRGTVDKRLIVIIKQFRQCLIINIRWLEKIGVKPRR